MRPVVAIAVLGSALSLSTVEGQTTAEPATANSTANPSAQAGTSTQEAKPRVRRRKPIPIWVATDGTVAEQRAAAGETEEAEPEPSVSAPAPVPAPAPPLPTVQAAPPGPPQKNLTGDEFQLIHAGSTAKEVLAVLGPPSSRIVIPDDDDHLRETLEYWVKGAPAATIRLDNGRVVKVETKPK